MAFKISIARLPSALLVALATIGPERRRKFWSWRRGSNTKLAFGIHSIQDFRCKADLT